MSTMPSLVDSFESSILKSLLNIYTSNIEGVQRGVRGVRGVQTMYRQHDTEDRPDSMRQCHLAKP